jgi:hypothetical protein
MHPSLHAIFTVKKLISGPLEENVFKDSTAAINFLRKDDDK